MIIVIDRGVVTGTTVVYIPFKYELGGYQYMIFSMKRASTNKIHPVPIVDIINNYVEGHETVKGIYITSREGIKDYLLRITNEETRKIVEFKGEALIMVWDRRIHKHRLVYESDFKNFQIEQRNCR
jgi:hypothetical protein